MPIEELVNESTEQKENCNLCKEACLATGKKTEYGSIVVFRTGSLQEGWFAALSPKTGGLEKDFTLQLMPFSHLTHFAQISKNQKLSENYGIAFAKLSNAMAKIMAEERKEFKATEESKDLAVSIASYGKCTNWKEKKEHLHIKIFPFRGNIGQPYTVDSSFGRKKGFNDEETGKSFVKMNPVKKINIPKKRFEELSTKLLKILSEGKE